MNIPPITAINAHSMHSSGAKRKVSVTLVRTTQIQKQAKSQINFGRKFPEFLKKNAAKITTMTGIATGFAGFAGLIASSSVVNVLNITGPSTIAVFTGLVVGMAAFVLDR